jgi:hypothetical protein
MEIETIISIVLGILLLVAGGIIKKVWSELKAFIDAVAEAIADNEVNDAEIVNIINHWKAFGGSVKELIASIIALIPKRRA